ncbi:hypothetical protein V4890_05415 [Ralstonia solanacearum species complex bacterium KE056]|uniref:hypothetical protein n=1 Tax=Ralstonia solanacearum species complex bacterium KE056 TaxID=3119585 RepID=UPI002FC2B6D5
MSRQSGTDGNGLALGHVGHDRGTARVPPQETRKANTGKASEGLGHVGHVGHEKNTEIQHAHDPDTGAPFTPYCVPMPADRLAAMLAEIREAIATLADAEGWPDAHRLHVLDILRRQPAYTLADDLAYFRERLSAIEAMTCAAEIGRQPLATHDAMRKCATCKHMTHHAHGVPMRCQMGKALGWRHHEWLDAPNTLNTCKHHDRI